MYRLGHRNPVCLVQTTGNGYARTSCLANITANIELLFVREAYRRQAVGTKLVLILCEFFSSQGVQDISVRYVVGSSEGEGFWTRLGFKPRIVTAGVKRQRLKEIFITKFRGIT
ncbi:GNAT family N-acetyltransferase [Candidatus Poribacteria bacterium]|nr:GNAT family N-acetyltransferase [Candidatus Poribacteria bacterium]